ncbi:MAG: hypothetical protein FJ295_08565 [Planctomycetes bacterium]|nr:hypothetical protein [Planctomycetota bacterium]
MLLVVYPAREINAVFRNTSSPGRVCPWCALGFTLFTIVAVTAQERDYIPSVRSALPSSTAPDRNAQRPSGLGDVLDSPTIVELKIQGNRRVSLNKINSHLRSRRGQSLDSNVVQADVRRLMKDGLFRDVRTFTEPAPGGVILVYEVFERPTIEKVEFHGNHGFSDKQLLKQCDLKQGDPLNQYLVEEGRRKLEEFYHDKGYPKAEVSIAEGNNPNDAGVMYSIAEGPLTRIINTDFVGNTIADDARLRTQIQSKPGALKWFSFVSGKLDKKKVGEDIERLTAYYRNLGFFRARISREIRFDSSGSYANVTYVIDEGPRYVVRDVSIVGNDKFTTEELREKLELRAGDYFNQARMNRDIGSLKDTFGSRGHVFADVQVAPRFSEEPGVIDLVYKIKEGEPFRVGMINVQIEGENPHTRNSTVLNRVSLRPGDLVDIRELRASESRIKASSLFELDRSKANPPQIVVVPPDAERGAATLVERPKPRAGSSIRR